MRKKLLFDWWSQGGGAAYSPLELGAKLKHWSETDGLVNGQTTEAGTVTSSSLVQLSDRSGNNTHWTNDGNAPTFDGSRLVFAKASSQGMINAALLSLIAADTQGELVVVGEKIAGEDIYPFTASRNADTLKRSLFGIRDSDDRVLMQLKQDNSNINTETTANVFMNAGKFIISFRPLSSGSYGLYTDDSNGFRWDQNTSTSKAGSLPSNAWFGNITSIGNFCMMKLKDSSPIYYSGYVRAIIYTSERMTLQERTSLFCYLSDKYL